MTSSQRTPDKPEFTRQQYEFTAHIRNPDRNPRPEGVEDRRMKIYRELFYNNVEDFMASTYPVLRKITPEDRWHAMIRDYFANHLSHTPLFPEMPREFLKYLENEREASPDDPPFMLELAHYEWIELALSIAEQEIDDKLIDGSGDLLDGVPMLSPLAWPLSYQFPVHKIGPDFLPETPGESPTFLVVYRDRDGAVHFLETNPVTARLIQLMSENNTTTGREMLNQIAVELGHPEPDVVVSGGLEILKDLQVRDVVPGVRI